VTDLAAEEALALRPPVLKGRGKERRTQRLEI